MPKVVDRSEFLTAAAAEGFGSGSTLTRQQVKDVAAKHGVTLPRWLLNDEQYYEHPRRLYVPTDQLRCATCSCTGNCQPRCPCSRC